MNATLQMAARRYRIERYLTEGGMGAIYIGKKLGPGGFEKEVVLKQLLPEYTARPEFRDLFFREAKISATLDHVNIVHTFDLVESEESLFIVMEYVRGADLRTITRRAKLRRRELSVAAAVHVALETLAGLSYAHTRRNNSGASLGIIHRDVSPSNILCSAQGEVKLSDFGIAKASSHASVFYRVRGKVGYMSPEQARNEAIDARTDLYSVAVCLYEALTGERLFIGDLSTPPDVIYGQLPAPPSRKRSGLPASLDKVLLRALAINPGDRYQSASAFAEALRHVAHYDGLLCSAPQLAEHLRDILGDDPGRWLREDNLQSERPDTQKISLKSLEGKEASSLGVVEGSNLYVVSGGDVVSPGVVGSSKSESGLDIGSVAAFDPSLETTRKVQNPAHAAEQAAAAEVPDLFIPVHEDEEEPTRSRPPLPGVTPPKSRNPTNPYGNSSDTSPRTVPPPPPLEALAPPETISFESPFEDEEAEANDYPPTPPPLQVTPPPTYDDVNESAPPLSAHHQSAHRGPPPGLPRPSGSQGGDYPMPEVPGFALRPPDTVDFGNVVAAPPPRTAPSRSGPPGLLVFLVLMAAIVGGAKVAQVVTRSDLAALEASLSAKASTKTAPTKMAPTKTAPTKTAPTKTAPTKTASQGR